MLRNRNCITLLTYSHQETKIKQGDYHSMGTKHCHISKNV